MILINLEAVYREVSRNGANGFGKNMISLNVDDNRLILLAAIKWFHALINSVKCGQMFFQYTDLITHGNYKLSIRRLLAMAPPEADRRDSAGQAIVNEIAHNKAYVHLSREMANELSKVVIDYALDLKDHFNKKTFYKIMAVPYGLNDMARRKCQY